MPIVPNLTVSRCNQLHRSRRVRDYRRNSRVDLLQSNEQSACKLASGIEGEIGRAESDLPIGHALKR
jgi:hypothetical protein